jgi:hypothetical protein
VFRYKHLNPVFGANMIHLRPDGKATAIVLERKARTELERLDQDPC